MRKLAAILLFATALSAQEQRGVYTDDIDRKVNACESVDSLDHRA